MNVGMFTIRSYLKVIIAVEIVLLLESLIIFLSPNQGTKYKPALVTSHISPKTLSTKVGLLAFLSISFSREGSMFLDKYLRGLDFLIVWEMILDIQRKENQRMIRERRRGMAFTKKAGSIGLVK